MIGTIYIIGILICPIIIMILYRIFPKFMKDFDLDIVVTIFCMFIWPLILVIALVVGFYFGCFLLINLGNHKE